MHTITIIHRGKQTHTLTNYQKNCVAYKLNTCRNCIYAYTQTHSLLAKLLTKIFRIFILKVLSLKTKQQKKAVKIVLCDITKGCLTMNFRFKSLQHFHLVTFPWKNYSAMHANSRLCFQNTSTIFEQF